jgi:hypothetical protein
LSTPSLSVELGGVTYQIPLPFLQVSGPVVLTPLIETDEQSRSIELRVGRWQVTHLDSGRRLPAVLGTEAVALRMAREFEADRGISWDSDDIEVQSWTAAWLEQNVSSAGGDR